MFDVGFTELLLIGVVALVVIGPERLPDVARNVGRYVGKLQRFVTGVKRDIRAELETGELKKLIGDQKSELDELRKVVHSTRRELDADMREITGGAKKTLKSLETAADTDAKPTEKDGAPKAPSSTALPDMTPPAESGASPDTATGTADR